MADKEKVLKGLECCSQMTGNACRQCPYDEECAKMIGSGSAHLCADALELLKEQGAVEPEVQIQNEIDRIYRCPKCYKAFFYKNQKYCDRCGQAVKWE